MNGSRWTRTFGLGGVMASMATAPSLDGGRMSSSADRRPPRHALQVVGQLDLAPVARPGALEIGGVVARLDGGVDAHLADDTPGKLTVERARRGIVGRAARARHDDDVARRIAARR